MALFAGQATPAPEHCSGVDESTQHAGSLRPPAIPLEAACFHRNESILGSEHHAEHEQHQRATDVDQDLHRADEIGPRQEEQARRGGQRQNQIKRHANDIGGDHDGHRKRARESCEQQEENEGQ